ncbi:DUF6226 family protein [Dactylosporangium sucinum]|uniref:Uncharacterized protein n=1 Tax=Dactylosporangium sucinum TaxID=1424081 RepID=A0A917U5W8_9ACTN|nr:DUF6226 family protein [Dactylosporangium sucinum]GGM59524.1 hypothetical protein GCM10007977_071360 [Dactylosporangium sucinum]
MVTLDELRARVAADYAPLGLPSWPDPHPGGAAPREEEYSRLTEPMRYRILRRRVELWAARIAELPGVVAEAVDDGVRLTSPRPGTLPLVLLGRDVPLPHVEIAVVRPSIAITTQPDCGCDACDTGSADLLSTVDDAIGTVIGGPFVALVGPGWLATWHPEGAAASNVDLRWAVGVSRRLADGQQVRLPAGASAFVGRSWLD